jgi:DNA (cytosine-5)-methyltransferase 1
MDGMPLTLSEIQTFCNHDNLQSLLNGLVDKKYLRLEQCKELVNGKRVYINDLMSAIKSDQKEELARVKALVESDTATPGYNICKGKLSFPVSKILDSNDICPTLTATDSNRLAVVIGGTIVRKLNHLELKRVCGFPETLKLPASVNVYDLFGNMATPPVLYKLIELMFD